MGNSTGFDCVNNIEQVKWRDAVDREYSVTIKEHDLSFSKQPFAVA